ncbi:MAG: hypothetical protein ACRDIY_08400 [Chloroflexota bacterium]
MPINISRLIIGVVLATSVVGCAGASGSATTENAVSSPAMSITLSPENDSHISGTAMLLPRGKETQVLISVTDEPAGASEPAHIHTGRCGPTLGAIAYPLQNVENGRSTTTVNAPLSSIADGHHAINVHQSAKDLQHTVACGNIPRPGA